jgi:hypothetical protein
MGKFLIFCCYLGVLTLFLEQVFQGNNNEIVVSGIMGSVLTTIIGFNVLLRGGMDERCSSKELRELKKKREQEEQEIIDAKH